MLDVGTGVGALAVAYAELFPQLTVVGIDVLPRVLALAETTVADSPVRRPGRPARTGRRHPRRAGDVRAGLAAGAVRATGPLRAGLDRLRAALVPGGWLVLGHGKFGGDPLGDAVSRFKTVAYGGTALDDAQASALLRGAGFEDVRSMPTPPGAPALTVRTAPRRLSGSTRRPRPSGRGTGPRPRVRPRALLPPRRRPPRAPRHGLTPA